MNEINYMNALTALSKFGYSCQSADARRIVRNATEELRFAKLHEDSLSTATKPLQYKKGLSLIA